VYGRSFNPTVRHLGRQLAALEDMESGYACSSGRYTYLHTLLRERAVNKLSKASYLRNQVFQSVMS
jgi:O-acetylhomoserine/O-acetylserine sulfhydrylase-like pyridoxal-dependent enzyme